MAHCYASNLFAAADSEEDNALYAQSFDTLDQCLELWLASVPVITASDSAHSCDLSAQVSEIPACSSAFNAYCLELNRLLAVSTGPSV